MAKEIIKNGKSAEAFRREIVKFLSSGTVSMSALCRESKVSQPSLHAGVTMKSRFNPTLDTVDNLRGAIIRIKKNPTAKY